MARPTTAMRIARQFSLAVLAVVIATLLTFPLASRVVHSRDLLFIAAVVLISRSEGVVSGLCVALLSVISFDWYFDQTPHVLDFTVGNGLRVVVFIAVSLMITLLDRQRRRASERLVTANVELQRALA